MHFDLQGNRTTIWKEGYAGILSFFTVLYIVAVNAAVLSEAGIPYEAAAIATILASVTGCLLMGLWANLPVIVVPGMGINAMFTYTIVQSGGLQWQEALAAVFVTGVLFIAVAFTPLMSVIAKAIPDSLKDAITVGIGILLSLIGLQKAGIVTASPDTMITLGELTQPHTVVSLIGIVITAALFIRNIPGSLLIGMVLNTILAKLFGLIDFSQMEWTWPSLQTYGSIFGALSGTAILSIVFWSSAFSLAVVIIFENIGLIHGQSQMAGQPGRFKRGVQANAVSALTCSILGTSPTVAAVESVSGIAAGGRTGLTAIVTGALFATTLLFIPVLKMVPDSAIAPVLILVGGLMMQQIRSIRLDKLSESFPAILVILLIPLTYSIVDGMAFGFIAYPVIKLLAGQARTVPVPIYFIALLFLVQFILI
jgi:AGZA family xanthine/uracil permease-like MFS transporter